MIEILPLKELLDYVLEKEPNTHSNKRRKTKEYHGSSRFYQVIKTTYKDGFFSSKTQSIKVPHDKVKIKQTVKPITKYEWWKWWYLIEN